MRNGDVVVQLTALRDTGNQLHDPISGKPVLVIGTEAACELTGLSATQLRTPLQTIQTFPGLRLIPYRSVGNDGGFLLAKRFADVTIGERKQSALVAFAAETNDVLDNARGKLLRKNADLVVANDVSRADAGFGVDTNAVTLITRDDIRELPLMSKREAADAILDRVAEL